MAAAAVLGSWPGWQQKCTSASLVPYGLRLLCRTPCGGWERIISAECSGEAAEYVRCLCVLILTLSLQCICLVKSWQGEGVWHTLFLILDKLVRWECYANNNFFPVVPSAHSSSLLWAGFTSWQPLQASLQMTELTFFLWLLPCTLDEIVSVKLPVSCWLLFDSKCPIYMQTKHPAKVKTKGIKQRPSTQGLTDVQKLFVVGLVVVFFSSPLSVNSCQSLES